MLHAIGTIRLSDTLSGFVVKISKTKKTIVKINAQTSPTNMKQIINADIIPASEPSQVLSLFHLICFLPKRIPI
jgi:hypothetical protein